MLSVGDRSLAGVAGRLALLHSRVTHLAVSPCWGETSGKLERRLPVGGTTSANDPVTPVA
jgi:hypothetical protein